MYVDAHSLSKSGTYFCLPNNGAHKCINVTDLTAANPIPDHNPVPHPAPVPRTSPASTFNNTENSFAVYRGSWTEPQRPIVNGQRPSDDLRPMQTTSNDIIHDVDMDRAVDEAQEIRLASIVGPKSRRVQIPQQTSKTADAEGVQLHQVWITSSLGNPQPIGLLRMVALDIANNPVFGEPWAIDATPDSNISQLQQENNPENNQKTFTTPNAAIGVRFAPTAARVKRIKVRFWPGFANQDELVLVVTNSNDTYVRHIDLGVAKGTGDRSHIFQL